MPQFFRTLVLAAIFLGVTVGLISTIAMAKTLHKYRHHTWHYHAHHATRTNSRLSSAQTHLAHLGYYPGKVDGLMGPKTRFALKNFQRDHYLPVTGALTTQTYNAILEADHAAVAAMGGTQESTAAPDFYATHPDYYGHVSQDYSNPLQLGQPQAIPNRYGKLDLDKDGAEYTLTYNGQPVLNAEEQPSVIGVSKTFDLGTEDAIIVSTYRSQSGTCTYDTYLLALRADGSHVQEIGNCTHAYKATVKDDSLFITFPEKDDARAVGATYRYENGDLEKL